MSLSDRIRPDVEAAPWVVEEIKKLEKDCLRLMAENLKLKQALKKIAIGGCECCTEGSLFRDEMIDEARSALEEK